MWYIAETTETYEIIIILYYIYTPHTYTYIYLFWMKPKPYSRRLRVRELQKADFKRIFQSYSALFRFISLKIIVLRRLL